MSAPIYENLIRYSEENRISFAMPGHKGGAGLREGLIKCDVTELGKTEDLHGKSEGVKKARRLLSELYHSRDSFILTSGSTACIQAMIFSTLKRGDVLLCFSDCHMSVINACALLGCGMRIVQRELDLDFHIPKGTPEIEDILDSDSRIRAVLVTSPNYYGMTCDIERLSEVCHERNIPLLVDEAHGAHFIVSDMLPKSAAELGADLVCQSAHKTLNALTGAAYLHASGPLADLGRLEKAVSMIETSSPSYVIAASADTAREDLESEKKWEAIISLVRCFKFNIQYKTKIKPLINDDFTRLVLNFAAYDTTGFEIERILSEEYGIDIEAADLDNIVMIVTPPNTNEDIDALFDALVKISGTLSPRKTERDFPALPKYSGELDPQKAFFSECEKVPFSQSAGKISAATVTVYPPGVPIIYAGGEISEEMLSYIGAVKAAGGKITGADDMIEVVK
ncbi:MAG: aminotransferase class I/II-fold pyridoxal phosphate-dependent enzyme [Clostridiales bacterium]|nr:aminotransferase class I/II-fold pyridoxal phosphate-dependent enzyme [Clostridiales bacterium]